MAGERFYCIWCEEEHPSHHWYFPYHPEARWCSAIYQRLLRIGQRMQHPLWLVLRGQTASLDATGRPISVLRQRADIAGVMQVESILRTHSLWSDLSNRIWAIGLIFQAYWPESMLLLLVPFTSRAPHAVTAGRLRLWWRRAARTLSGCRYVQGVLVAGSAGLDPMRNPSERRAGLVRYRALVANLQLWQRVSVQIAGALGPSGSIVSVRAVLSAMRCDGFRVYTDRICYGNVRLVRAIIVACGYSISDSEDDWAVLGSMSSSMVEKCRRWGLSHGAAIALRDAMRASYPAYSFLDLTCFLCLSR